MLYVVLFQVQTGYPGTSKLNLIVLDSHLVWLFPDSRIQVLNITICWNSLKMHSR